MKYVQVKAKTREEAIEKCGLKIGQLAKITDSQAHGNVNGEWTVHPDFEPIKEDASLSTKQG